MSTEAPSQTTAAASPGHDGVRRVVIAMNGVTGRMGMNQHLIRSICAIRAQGGLRAGETTIWPEPILVGRSEPKLARLAAEQGIERWSTDLDQVLADPEVEIGSRATRASRTASSRTSCSCPGCSSSPS